MGARPLRRGTGEALWAQLLADLRRRIAEGEFVHEFPGELVVAHEYGVSRHTAREAISRLRQEGSVTAQRGRAQRVVTPPEFVQPLGAVYSLFAAVEQAGQEQRSVVRALDVRADAVVAARLGLEESAPLVYLERLRLAADEPLAIDRVWLPEHLAAVLLDVDFARTALYDELARRCGVQITGGRETIRAVVPTQAERQLLGIGDDTPVAALVIERLGCSHGHPVEWRSTLARGDRFGVTASSPHAEIRHHRGGIDRSGGNELHRFAAHLLAGRKSLATARSCGSPPCACAQAV
jgi:GntR family transcriptional regulator